MPRRCGRLLPFPGAAPAFFRKRETNMAPHSAPDATRRGIHCLLNLPKAAAALLTLASGSFRNSLFDSLLEKQ